MIALYGHPGWYGSGPGWWVWIAAMVLFWGSLLAAAVYLIRPRPTPAAPGGAGPRPARRGPAAPVAPGRSRAPGGPARRPRPGGRPVHGPSPHGARPRAGGRRPHPRRV